MRYDKVNWFPTKKNYYFFFEIPCHSVQNKKKKERKWKKREGKGEVITEILLIFDFEFNSRQKKVT